jgi:hypothetical protein
MHAAQRWMAVGENTEWSLSWEGTCLYPAGPIGDSHILHGAGVCFHAGTQLHEILRHEALHVHLLHRLSARHDNLTVHPRPALRLDYSFLRLETLIVGLSFGLVSRIIIMKMHRTRAVHNSGDTI